MFRVLVVSPLSMFLSIAIVLSFSNSTLNLLFFRSVLCFSNDLSVGQARGRLRLDKSDNKKYKPEMSYCNLLSLVFKKWQF